MPAINKQPPVKTKPRKLPSTRNRIKTIKVNPNSSGGIIQLHTGYGVKTNNGVEGSGKKRETVPPLPPPPPPHHHQIVLKTEKPSFYYNPILDDIFPSTPPTYTPPPTPPTIYNRPLNYEYSRETGKIISDIFHRSTINFNLAL